MAATACFGYTEDHHPLNDATHAHPAVPALAAIIIAHPALLRVLSDLLRQDVGVVPPQLLRISDDYRDSRGGILSPEQERLGSLIDDLYATADLKELQHRRGAVLERIVLDAERMRLPDPPTDTAILNAKNIALSSHHRPINGYSVDVATCLASAHQVRFLACKLQPRYMTADDLLLLTDIRERFEASKRQIQTAVCCLQRRADIRSAVIDRFRHYQMTLMSLEGFERYVRSQAGT